MTSELWKNVNYISGLKYITSSFIREYDISKANISILRSKGVIDQQFYEKLKVASRDERQVTIGLLERENKEVSKILNEGIIEAKRILFVSNQIEDHEVLAIKNDAVFTINKFLTQTKINDLVEFKLKNTFTSFMKLNKIEIYYGCNKINNQESIQIKGLGKNTYLHDEFMTDFIIYIMSCLETGDLTNAISSFNNFYNEYINRKLNIGYYREYNARSGYRIVNQPYILTAIENSDYNKSIVNIRYNMDILRTMYSYITEKFFIEKKF